MFEQVFDSFRKATEANVQMQQELFKKWTSLMPEASNPTAPWTGQVQQWQKKWSETVNEILKKQRENAEAQFKQGLANIETAFRLGEAKSVDELRAKTIELWQQCFASLRQASETQARQIQAAMEKCAEFFTPASV
jgi:hypothetical protein